MAETQQLETAQTKPDTAYVTDADAMSAMDAEIAGLMGKSETPQRQETAEPKPALDPEPGKSLLDDDQDIPGPTTGQETGKHSVKQLAEKAGIDLAEVVFVVDNGDGSGPREMSYADVKARLNDSEQLEADRLTFETEQREASNALLNARREFEALVAQIPPESWPAGFAEQIADQSVRTAEYETRMTLAAIPTWKDPTVMQADKQDMTAYMAEWGFSPAEVDNIMDHRTLNFVRYHTRLVRRVAELEKAGPGAKAPAKGSQKGRGNKQARLKAQVDSGAITGDQAAASYLKSIGL